MRKFQFLFIAFVFKGFLLQAQNTALETQDSLTHPFKKIMVIPFEEIMYIGGIQNELMQSSGKSHKEIVKFFRYGLSSAIQYEFLYTCPTTSLIHYNDTTHDLERTYAGIVYKFEPFKEEVVEEKTNKKKQLSEQNPKQDEATHIKNGQVISTKNVSPKFASLQIKDTSILGFLNQKYGADLFVFITQLDIENDLSDQLALANDTYVRYIKAHYAIVDVQGNFSSKGLVKIQFPNSVNEMEKIQAIYFKELAKKLREKLPQIQIPKPQKSVENEKIKAE